MQDEIAIRVDNVSKDFILPHERVNSIKGLFTSLTKGSPWRTKETQHALKNVSFEIKKGEFFGIVGRNGSGKSTLLKLIAGIYQPTKGQIHVNGKLVPFIELGVGFNMELTGRENVYLNGAMLGFSKSEVGEMYDDIVEFAELERFMDQKLKNYSSGMQVRLAFSMATRSKADILLVDEVLAVGDADFQRKCYQYFKLLKKNKKTVVFVTHDMSAIEEYCEKAILVQDGIKKHEGDASKIAAEYLMMFNKPAGDMPEVAAGDNRWGNHRLSFTKPRVDVTEDKITLATTVRKSGAMDKLESLVFSIDVRDDTGNLVAGNSFRITEGLDFKTKTDKKLVADLANNLGGGDYSFDMSLSSSDRVTIYDHWNSAVRFSNVHGRNTYFPVVVSGEVMIK